MSRVIRFPLALLLVALALPASAVTRPLLAHVQGLAAHVLPPLGNEHLALQAQPLNKSTALTYAVDIATRLHSDTSGEWSQRQGRALWRVKLHSADARSLSARLQDLHGPAGSVLRLADGEGVVWFEQTLGGARPLFQTPIVPGDTLVLEWELSRAERADAELRLTGVQHGFRDLRSLQKSGSCNIDTVCPQGDAWTDAIRATARVTINGTSLCSAMLLNNTANDGTPLLLTAAHCGLTSGNASATVVYWNYATSTCGGTPDGSLRQSQSGATLLASNPDPDFALVRLDRQPDPAFDVYYAGWDASGVAISRGVGVHHPSGDEKRISLYENRPRKVRALVDGEPVQSWEVRWSEGVTEPGSSGSPMFDSAGRVVGQLSGGNSSCDNPGGADVYGRFDFGWQASNQPSGQLKAWLDPINSGNLVHDGLDNRDAPARAVNDSFVAEAGVTRAIPLAVLSNDLGPRPLRLLDAQAAHGSVQIVGDVLLYQAASGVPLDQISYTMIDRNGQTSSAQAQMRFESSTEVPATSATDLIRGGSMSLGLLLLLGLVGLRRRGARA